jgi:hypothetical protein
MILRFRHLLLATVLSTGLLGCNWGLILAFRSQMRAVTQYTAWEGPQREVFVFRKPLVSFDDLSDFDVYPERIDERTAVLRYRRVDAPAGTDVDCEIRLLFEEGKLAGMIFPAPWRDGLGRGNLMGFFAMMGGADFPAGVDVGAIPKSQLVAANLFPASAEPLGPEVELLFMPVDSRNRPIHLRLKERPKKPGYFSETYLSFKRR